MVPLARCRVNQGLQHKALDLCTRVAAAQQAELANGVKAKLKGRREATPEVKRHPKTKAGNLPIASTKSRR